MHRALETKFKDQKGVLGICLGLESAFMVCAKLWLLSLVLNKQGMMSHIVLGVLEVGGSGHL